MHRQAALGIPPSDSLSLGRNHDAANTCGLDMLIIARFPRWAVGPERTPRYVTPHVIQCHGHPDAVVNPSRPRSGRLRRFVPRPAARGSIAFDGCFLTRGCIWLNARCKAVGNFSASCAFSLASRTNFAQSAAAGSRWSKPPGSSRGSLSFRYHGKRH